MKMKLEVALNQLTQSRTEQNQLRTEKTQLLTEQAQLRGSLAVALKQQVGADHDAFTMQPVQATTEEPVECSVAEDIESPLSAGENTGLSATNRRTCSQVPGGPYSFATAFVFKPYSVQDRTISVGLLQSCGIATPAPTPSVPTPTPELKCWGLVCDQGGVNGFQSCIPTQSNGDPYGWRAVSVNNHVCGILSDETAEMMCWGGDNVNGERDVPTVAGGKYTWQAVSTGLQQTCGILGPCTGSCMGAWAAGEMLCWGRNSNDQITIPTPASVNKNTGRNTYTWLAVTVSDSHSCGILSDTGHLKCWGFNDDNQCDIPTNVITTCQEVGGVCEQSVAQYSWQSVALGRTVSQATVMNPAHTCGIVSGTSELKCWGSNSATSNGVGPCDVPTNNGAQYAWKAVSIGGTHTCGILSDSTNLKCWGSGPNEIIDLSSGGPDGFSTGGPSYDQLLWQAVTTSPYHICGILVDPPELKCWGSNSHLQTSVPTNSGAEYTWLPRCTFTTCGMYNPVSTKISEQDSQISFSLYPTALTLGTLQVCCLLTGAPF